MRRFFGQMPFAEVEIRKNYVVLGGGIVSVESGKHGWIIIFEDYSTEFKDNQASAEENFNEAFRRLKYIFPDSKEIENKPDSWAR